MAFLKRDEPVSTQPVEKTTAEGRRREIEEEAQDTEGLVVDGKELTAEEIADVEKLNRLSTNIQIPNEKLDPNYEYRWLNKMHMKNYRRRLGVGWKTPDKSQLRQLSKVPIDELHIGTHFAPDGTLCIDRDLVFACIPKRIPEAIRASHHRQSQARLMAGRKQFHDSGQLLGVETTTKF